MSEWQGSRLTNTGFVFGYSSASRCMDQSPGFKRKSFSVVAVHAGQEWTGDSVYVTHTKEGLYEIKKGNEVLWTRPVTPEGTRGEQ